MRFKAVSVPWCMGKIQPSCSPSQALVPLPCSCLLRHKAMGSMSALLTKLHGEHVLSSVKEGNQPHVNVMAPIVPECACAKFVMCSCSHALGHEGQCIKYATANQLGWAPFLSTAERSDSLIHSTTSHSCPCVCIDHAA